MTNNYDPLYNQFDKTIKTQRLTDIAETDKEDYQDFLTNVPCMIQPLEDSFGEDLQGGFGKDFLMFCTVLDIKEGDLVVDGTTVYKVVGLEDFKNWLGNSTHMEVRIRLFND